MPIRRTAAFLAVLLLSRSAALAQGTAIPPTPIVPEVYLYGNPVSGPYAPSLAGSTVRLNGVQVYPLLADLNPADPVQATTASVQRNAFRSKGWDLQRQLEQEGESCEDIAHALAAYYRSSPDLVTVTSPVDGNCFTVRWPDGLDEEILVVPSAPGQSPEDSARGELRLIQHLLEKGCLIIVSSHGRVIVPADDAIRLQLVRDEIVLARSLSVEAFGSSERHFRDAQWPGLYLPAAIARQFARPLDLAAIRQED